MLYYKLYETFNDKEQLAKATHLIGKTLHRLSARKVEVKCITVHYLLTYTFCANCAHLYACSKHSCVVMQAHWLLLLFAINKVDRHKKQMNTLKSRQPSYLILIHA